MKTYENKVSYQVTFEMGPDPERDTESFLEAIADYVGQLIRHDPDLVFVDPEYADDRPDVVQLNFLVRSPAAAAAAMRVLFEKERFQSFRYASEITQVFDSKGQLLYPMGPQSPLH
jgi:hypothetical protein